MTTDWDNIFLREISLRYRELDEVRERAARAHDRCAAADALLNSGGTYLQLRAFHESRWAQWFAYVEKERNKYLLSKYVSVLWHYQSDGCAVAMWLPFLWPVSFAAAHLGLTDLERLNNKFTHLRCVRCRYPLDHMPHPKACPECGLPWPLLPPTPATTKPM